MKINELAKISHVKAETIRMYRNKGLLVPRQNENGYYEYSKSIISPSLPERFIFPREDILQPRWCWEIGYSWMKNNFILCWIMPGVMAIG